MDSEFKVREKRGRNDQYQEEEEELDADQILLDSEFE